MQTREDSVGGGEKFSTSREGGQEVFNLRFLESLGEIKGHVKNLLRKLVDSREEK